MCMGGGGAKDNSAEIAAQQEAQRQANIAAGQRAIDSAFSRFNDNYYKGVQDAYLNNYDPQINQQYNKARQQLQLNLSRSGALNSSAGAGALSNLQNQYNQTLSSYGQNAIDAANQQRTSVENARQALYSQNVAAADPSASAASASAKAGSIAAPASYSPLGDLFSAAIQTTTPSVQAANAGYSNWISPYFNKSPATTNVGMNGGNG